MSDYAKAAVSMRDLKRQTVEAFGLGVCLLALCRAAGLPEPKVYSFGPGQTWNARFDRQNGYVVAWVGVVAEREAEVKDIEIDGRYRHISTGKEYWVAGPCRIKHPDTGAWLDGVEYYSRHDDDQTLYVRTVENFLASFVKVVS